LSVYIYIYYFWMGYNIYSTWETFFFFVLGKGPVRWWSGSPTLATLLTLVFRLPSPSLTQNPIVTLVLARRNFTGASPGYSLLVAGSLISEFQFLDLALACILLCLVAQKTEESRLTLVLARRDFTWASSGYSFLVAGSLIGSPVLRSGSCMYFSFAFLHFLGNQTF